MPPRVLIGVPCYNGAEDLLPWTLEAIRQRTAGAVPYDLVVVDDSGKEDHRRRSSVVAERFGAFWIAHPDNRGITAAWNTVVRSSSAREIVLLNDDIIVSPGWLDALTFFLWENPHAGAVGMSFYFITRSDVPQLLSSPTAKAVPRHYATKEPLAVADVPSEDGTPGRVMCAPGCAFGFTREKYDLVGGFDPSMRQWYNESDFGSALAAKGHASYVLSWPFLWHIWGATFERSPELFRGHSMDMDRRNYIAKWGGDFNYTDPKLMSALPFRKVRWLTPTGPREAVIESKYGFHPSEG